MLLTLEMLLLGAGPPVQGQEWGGHGRRRLGVLGETVTLLLRHDRNWEKLSPHLKEIQISAGNHHILHFFLWCH